MATRTTRSAKSFLKPLHTWVGIIAGLFLAIVSVTGSLIVFRSEFERAALPSASPAGSRRVTVDEAAGAVAKFRPESRIRRVRLPLASGDPYIFQVDSEDAGTEHIAVDASSGHVLGTIKSGIMDWLVDLHRNLLFGKPGRKAVGVVGIVLLFLSATGLLMWLTGQRNWRAWISLRRSGSARRFNFELHRVSGLWAYVFLAVISFTGIERAYPDSFRQTVKWLTGTSPTVQAPKGIKTKSLRPLDDYLRAGRTAMPDGVPVELRLPGGKGAVDIHLYRAGDLSPSGNHVYLDPKTASVIQIDRIVDRPIGARFLAALAPIHYGEFGGMPIRIAWALLALTPVLLFITGLFAWWRPSNKRSKIAAAEEVASEDLALAPK